MPRMATVYDIFIASPGDVAAEREIAVKVIHKWNDLHSLARAIMLRPVRYEKNSHPTTRYEGQEAINRQCLDNSDLAIGIFGNRLGTPTSKAESGTAEELDRHIAAGKEAIIFFSQSQVSRNLSREDQKQLKKLLAYQETWKEKAYVGFFSDSSDKQFENFEDVFERALTLYMNELPSTTLTAFNSSSKPTPKEIAADLSSVARLLLSALASDESGGRAIISVSCTGTHVVCTGFDYPQTTSREKAKACAALKELEEKKLVNPFGDKGMVKINALGYDVADELEDGGNNQGTVRIGTYTWG